MGHRTEEERQVASELHRIYLDELHKRQLLNSDNYDKAILTLSSSGLAISLTFIKDIVPLSQAEFLWLIKFGWIFFLISIVISLLAYITSNKAIDVEMDKAERFYDNGNEAARFEKNNFSIINKYLNYFTGLSFVVALIAIVMFVILNLRGNSDMSNNNSKPLCTDSAPMPRMQAVMKPSGNQSSAPMPRMQSTPSSGTQNTAPQAK
ncbi:hypothetical protein C0W80_07600 [Photobacterium leiognathi subsp. mandapamensis]|uniref:YccF domain-containing protein n=1 Tax=Photobacterium leiognathi TaxID=553611 RepID=UPI000D16E0A4|nr:YccF domain-containing protein [Photobacterium leiognathi]PSV02573.1 hypothetical protein C0W80_07600 [Photobacterium leiognathi subsp. mandapamensis]